MATVAVSSSPAHYIRTIHTSFTAAHSNPWARSPSSISAAPLHQHHYGVSHQQVHGPLKHNVANSPASAMGGRRRAYAFRAPNLSVPAPTPRKSGGYKFDPFGDEPTSPVPTLSTLASLSAPPAPRLAPATLPQRKPSPSGFYNHQLAQQARRSPQPGYQARRQPGGAALENLGGAATTEVWRGYSPIPKGRMLTYEIEEYDYDGPVSSSTPFNAPGGNGGLLTTPLPSPRPASPRPVSPRTPISGSSSSTTRRSPSPSNLNPHSPAFTPGRPLTRTPSPPAAPAPQPSFSSTRQAMQDKDAKARLVAGILLNRVHVNKPMRRRPMFGDNKRGYVPSALSREVAVEA